MKIIEEQDVKKMNELLHKSSTVIIMTNIGGAIIGKEAVILDLFANIVNNLKESGFNEERLRDAFETGLKHKEKRTNETKLEEILKSELKELKNILEECLGDDDDE